ncbi:MAG: amidohydrolase family protein [Clostridiales bacterium]|nr:amidohydrolase family protein [Clostridiales bacterium]
MLDLIIRNGTIVDGTGKDCYAGDIGIVGKKIKVIGLLADAVARKEIDAVGKYVTPGFIEPHSHADLGVLMTPSMESYLMQGVTTVVGGNCGHAMAPMNDEIYRSAIVDFPVIFKAEPKYFELATLMVSREKAKKAIKELYDIDLDWHTFDEYIAKCNENGMDCNIAPLAGYSAIRSAVMGMDSMRSATDNEANKLEQSVRDCMLAGAYGLSTGLDPQYLPGLFATDEETVRMLRVVREYNGIFTSHTFNQRMDGTGSRMDGYRVMIEQAKAADIRANVSHVHVFGMSSGDDGGLAAAKETLLYFEEAVASGLDLSYDIIPSPYSVDYTVPYFAFFLRPFLLMSGSREKLAENFSVPDFRLMVHKVIEGGMYPILDETQPMNYLGLLTMLRHSEAGFVGSTLTKIASLRKQSALDVMMDLFTMDPDMEANISMSNFGEAIDLLSRQPMAMVCADGLCCTKDTNFTANSEMPLLPNAMTLSFIPRYILSYGEPRFEDTIRRISGFVAERFGIAKRGTIKEGNFADIVVLDRKKLYSYDRDEQFLQYPDGFDHVIVNGTPVIEKKVHLKTSPGKMLRKSHV